MSARIYQFLTTCCLVFSLSATAINALMPAPVNAATGTNDGEAGNAAKQDSPISAGAGNADKKIDSTSPAAPQSPPPGGIEARQNPDSVAAKPEVAPDKPTSEPPPSDTSPTNTPAIGTENDTSSVANPNVRIVTEKDPAPPDTGPPDLHKAQFRLSGSMCYSCLNTLKRKLMQVYGVQVVRIDKPVHNLFQPYAPDVNSWAETVLVYDLNKVALADVRSYMRNNGYMSYKVVDKVFTESLESMKAKERQ